MESLCTLGLKTGEQLKKEGVYFGRSVAHPYIFFSAPYYSREINYSTPETEIISSFGEEQIGKKARVFIRVDPDRTFVFSSEIRTKSVWYGIENNIIKNSKKTLSDYLKIINSNLLIEQNVEKDKKIYYNLFTSKAELLPSSEDFSPPLPFDNSPINRNSEVLVSIPHLTPNYFVLCTSDTTLTPSSSSLTTSLTRPLTTPLTTPLTIPLTTPLTTPLTRSESDEEIDRIKIHRTGFGPKKKYPIFNTITGTSVPKFPNETSYFGHNYTCPNKDKIPVEPTI